MVSEWDWWAEQYDLAGNQPYTWWTIADSLLAASRFLCMHDIYRQLSGEEIMDLHKSIKQLPFPDETKVRGVIQMLRGMAACRGNSAAIRGAG